MATRNTLIRLAFSDPASLLFITWGISFLLLWTSPLTYNRPLSAYTLGLLGSYLTLFVVGVILEAADRDAA